MKSALSFIASAACSFTTSFHVSFWMSLCRRPVRAENRASLFSIGLSHGVAAKRFSSSVVRYSLWLS